jgi:hypothetical protein
MASSYGNHDAAACARYFSALALALAGEEKRARSTAENALAIARSLNDPFTMALTLYFASATDARRSARGSQPVHGDRA